MGNKKKNLKLEASGTVSPLAKMIFDMNPFFNSYTFAFFLQADLSLSIKFLK